tara:strand:- start:9020 stop:9421 length:402 start_codon:yes stop_codon:yes gene_type:complete
MAFLNSLNGWRRLGVVLILVWLIVLTGVLLLSTEAKKSGFLRNIEVTTSSISVPAPELADQLEQVKREQLGRDLKPWEKEWNLQKTLEIQHTNLVISPLKIFLVGIVFPSIIWLLFEVITFLIRWIRRGFIGH